MTGTCLCGAIEFSADEVAGLVFNCHCSRCRKSHGAAFATQTFAVRSSLHFNKGRQHLKEYASTGGMRAFCELCGSRLMNYAKDGGNYLSIAIACLEDYAGRPVADAFLDSKAPWYEPCSGVPGFSGLPSRS
jgi:hypothetical protein